MTGHYCPVEDCEYPPDSDSVSLSRVRSHINATSEGGHDWGELKPVVLDQVNDQGEASDDQPNDQGEGADGDDPEEGGDAYEEQWEGSQNGPDDPPGGAGAAADGDDDGDGASDDGGSGPEVSVSTPVIVAGFVIVAVVVVVAMRSPSEPAEAETSEAERIDDADDGGEMGGPDVPEEGAWT